MRLLSARYIAGETIDEALAVLQSLQDRSYPGVIDILGEDIADEAEARGVLKTYREAASALHDRRLDSYVSVKPTHFGLNVSPDLCEELYDALLQHCAALDMMVRVEMEDHTTTDETLAIFRALRAKHERVGVVLQARLFRTADDVAALPAECDIRMVKGIYLEPAEVAHTTPEPIRDAFVQLTELLLTNGHTVAIATHDARLADRVLERQARIGIPDERTYFEVLLGVQEKLWSTWKARGKAVRAYVPYGPQWRAYSQRRLRKNPEILRHLIKATLRLG
jgi:proline dehydrogenase